MIEKRMEYVRIKLQEKSMIIKDLNSTLSEQGLESFTSGKNQVVFPIKNEINLAQKSNEKSVKILQRISLLKR